MSPELQAFVRSAYGLLMLLTLLAALPHWRRYFLSERWGGYTEQGAVADGIQNPIVMPIVLAAWLTAGAGLLFGRFALPAAVVNLACCYYFFNRLRWKSVSRGMGAPGFISLWLGAVVFLLEFTSRHAAAVRDLALLTVRVDFAAIMISAGLYKLVAGYRHRNGLELGMANPEWSYWPAFWKTWSPEHPLFRFFNEMAWGTEVVCGLLMLFPATRQFGGAGILLSFVFIATQIRLGFLSEMVMVCCLMFFGPDTLIDGWVTSSWHQLGGSLAMPGTQVAGQTAMVAACWIYLGLLPLVRAGMFYNQLQHRSWPAPVQRALDAYVNFFGLILWRVFTADVVNFFIRIWEQPAAGARRLVSEFHRTGASRFSQVAECIALTSVFTTLKYYPSNRPLFEGRLLRYANTIPRAAASTLVFEWVNLAVRADGFDYVSAVEFTVAADARTVLETQLDPAVNVRGIPSFSPLHEGARPGSYAPLTPEAPAARSLKPEA